MGVISGRSEGIALILASGFCFGFLGIFGKAAFARGLSGTELLALRFLIAAATIGLFLACLRPRTIWLGWRSVVRCLLLGIVGYAVFSSCFFGALQVLSASLTVLLLYAYPVFVALGAAIFLDEALGPKTRVALTLATVGLFLLVGTDFAFKQPWGFLLGLGSAFFYSIYILLSRSWLKGVDLLAAVFWIQLGAGSTLALTVFSGPRDAFTTFWQGFGPVLGAAWMGSVLAMSFFLAGLQRLRASDAAILSTAEPLTAIIAAHFLLGERLSVWQIFGGLLLGAALILISRERRTS